MSGDLIAQAWNTENPDKITLELANRLERHTEELAALGGELPAARSIPRKQPGKVGDLRTRLTLNSGRRPVVTRHPIEARRGAYLLLGLALHLGRLPTDCMQATEKEKPCYQFDSRVSFVYLVGRA